MQAVRKRLNTGLIWPLDKFIFFVAVACSGMGLPFWAAKIGEPFKNSLVQIFFDMFCQGKKSHSEAKRKYL